MLVTEAPSSTIWTLAASSASTTIMPSSSVPLKMYVPSAVMLIVLPSIVTADALVSVPSSVTSADVPFSEILRAAASSYSPERSLSVNISDLLAASYVTEVVCALASELPAAAWAAPHPESMIIIAVVTASIFLYFMFIAVCLSSILESALLCIFFPACRFLFIFPSFRLQVSVSHDYSSVAAVACLDTLISRLPFLQRILSMSSFSLAGSFRTTS